MKKILLILFLIFVVSNIAKAASNAQTTDNMTRSERLALTGVLKKLQTCQNAELAGTNFSYKVTRKGSMCMYYERNKDASMTCDFPLSIAKKYGANSVTLNNAILDGSAAQMNPFVDSPLTRVFMENINLATKYCKQ